MKAPRGCSPSDGGTLQRQVMPMDLDVYWCDGSVRERWKQDVPSTITLSINGLDSQKRSRTKDLVISIINNQHPLKRRTNKRGLERMTSKDCCPGVVGTVRAVRALLEREPLKPTATQRIGTRALSDSGVTKAGSLNQGFAAPNGRYHLRRGVINHSVRAHLCLRLGAGSEICRQLRSQGKLLDPMVWSVLHLHAEPVGFPWDIHQTKGWALVDSHRPPRRTTRFFDVLTARIFQEKKP